MDFLLYMFNLILQSALFFCELQTIFPANTTEKVCGVCSFIVVKWVCWSNPQDSSEKPAKANIKKLTDSEEL